MFNYQNNGYSTPNYNQTNYNQPTYIPRTYIPTQYPQQMATQPQQQMQVQPQMQIQQPNQTMEIPYTYFGYGNLKEAESYILMPNQKAIFIDKANGMFYEKISNNDGIPVIYQYKRYIPQGENCHAEPQKQDSTIDLSQYATKDDLGKFVSLNQYNELLYKLEQLQKQIISAKPNTVNKQ